MAYWLNYISTPINIIPIVSALVQLSQQHRPIIQMPSSNWWEDGRAMLTWPTIKPPPMELANFSKHLIINYQQHYTTGQFSIWQHASHIFMVICINCTLIRYLDIYLSLFIFHNIRIIIIYTCICRSEKRLSVSVSQHELSVIQLCTPITAHHHRILWWVLINIEL